MNVTSLDQIKDRYYGEIGTPERNELERELESLRVGVKIRAAREKRVLNSTQSNCSYRMFQWRNN